MSKLSGQRAETKVGAGAAGIREEGLNWHPGKRRGKGGREQLPRNFPGGLAESPLHIHGDHQKPWVRPSCVLCAQVPLKRSLFLVTAGSKQPSLPRRGAVLSKGCKVHQASPLNLPPYPGVLGRLPGCWRGWAQGGQGSCLRFRCRRGRKVDSDSGCPAGRQPAPRTPAALGRSYQG